MILGMIDRIEKFRSDSRLFTKYLENHLEFLGDFLKDQSKNYCLDIKEIYHAELEKNKITIWYEVYDCPIGYFSYTFSEDTIGNILKIDEIGKQYRISEFKEEIKFLKDKIKSLENKIENLK